MSACAIGTTKPKVKTTGSEQLLSNKAIKASFIKTLYRDPSPEEQAELEQILEKLGDD